MSDWYKIDGGELGPMDRSGLSTGYGGLNSRQRSGRGAGSHSGHGFPGHAMSQSSPAPIAMDKGNKEHLHRFAGVAVGLASVVSEHILSHPCVVLRRQCQVHNTSHWYHLTPFTLFHTVFHIQRHQSMTTLWKGIGSSLMVKGIAVASESAINEFTPLPKDIDRHSSLKKISQHVLLKSISLIIVTPFYASSLVETVQSEIACERPGVFDCLVEGVGRLASFTSAQPTRLLPIWKLLAPTVLYGLCHYVISSLAKYRVSTTIKNELIHDKGSEAETVEKTIYELYYPELVATFTGNLLADTLLYPLETILHRLYLQGTRTIIDNTDTGLEVVPIITRYEGAFDCYSTLVAEEGFVALYKGFGALILQYALHMAILKLTRFMFETMSGGAREKSRGFDRRVTVGSTAPIHIDVSRGGEGRPGEGRHMAGESDYSRYSGGSTRAESFHPRNPYAVPDF